MIVAAGLHVLEVRYGLTATEILDAIEKRMRLRVALEGAVAEVQFERLLKMLHGGGFLTSYVDHDQDGYHDFDVVTLPGVSGVSGRTIAIEVKTIKKVKPNRLGVSRTVVEVQKTRAAVGDSTSRYYAVDAFDVVAVCLGRATGDWTQFSYALTADLKVHPTHTGKLDVYHDIKDRKDGGVWTTNLKEILDAFTP